MIQNKLLHNVISSLLVLFIEFTLFSQITFSQLNSWKQTNGPPGGTAWCFANNSSNTIFVGTEGYGVFKSTDFGSNWIPTGHGLPNYSIRALAINKQNIIFAGTDENGIYRSTNNGDTWISSNIGIDNTGVYSIAIDSEGIIYAATAGGKCSLYRSEDNGVNWKLVDTSTCRSASSVIINSKDYIFYSTSEEIDHMFYDNIYRSTDHGVSWSKEISGLQYGNSMGLSIDQHDNIYVRGWFNNNIFKSTHNGDEWELISNDSSGGEVWSLVADSKKHLFAAIQEIGIYRSLDNGNTWSYSNKGLGDKSLISLFVNSLDHIIAATDDGIYISTDSGDTWNYTSFGNSIIQSISASQEKEIFAGTYSGHVFSSLDGGNSWKNIFNNNYYLPTPPNSIAIHHCGTIFISNNDGIFYNNLHNVNWVKVKLSETDSVATSITINHSGNIFASSLTSVYQSDDTGRTWKKIYSPGYRINLLYTTPQDYILMSQSDLIPHPSSLLMLSTDTGKNWTTIDNHGANSIVVNWNGYIYAANGSIRRSTNNGKSWTQINAGLETQDISYLCVDSLGNVYAAGNYNIYVLTNNGDIWATVNFNLPHTPIYGLIGYPLKEIFVGTWGLGIWKSNGLITNIKNDEISVNQFILNQNYPNPFNPITTINYSLPIDSHVKLSLIDLLGREVRVLVDDDKTAGNYKIELSAYDLSSGVYFYNIQAAEFNQTKKLVLIR